MPHWSRHTSYMQGAYYARAVLILSLMCSAWCSVLHIASHTSEWWMMIDSNMHVTMCIFDSLFIINFVIVIIVSPFHMDAAITWQSAFHFWFVFFFILFSFLFSYSFLRAFACYLFQPTVDWLNEYCLYFVCLTSLTGSFFLEMNRMKNSTNVRCSGILLTASSHCDFFSFSLEKISSNFEHMFLFDWNKSSNEPTEYSKKFDIFRFHRYTTFFFVLIFDLLFHYR